MTLDQIEAFLAVRQLETMKAAAEALRGVNSAAAVSRRIKELKKSLDVMLFRRDPGGKLFLLPAGQKLLPYAYKLLNTASQARLAVREEQADTPLRLASARSLCSHFLPTLLKRVAIAHRGLRVVVRTASSKEVSELVQVGEAEIGLRYSLGSDERLEDFGIKRHTLQQDSLILVHRAEQHVPERLSVTELAHQPLIMFETGSTSWGQVNDLFRRAEQDPTVAYEVDSVETAKRLVDHGFGYSFIPRVAVETELRTKRFVEITVTGSRTQLNRNIDLLCSSTRPLSVGATAFWNTIVPLPSPPRSTAVTWRRFSESFLQ